MEFVRPMSSSRAIDRKFPPPLATAAQFVKIRSGNGDRCCPDQMVRGVRLQAVRSNGRFVLQEVKIPTEEVVYVHTIREQGRLEIRMERRKSASPDQEIIKPAAVAAAAAAISAESPAPVADKVVVVEKSPLAPRPIAPSPPLPSAPLPSLPRAIIASSPAPPLAIKSTSASRVDPEPVAAAAAPVLAAILPHSSSPTSSQLESSSRGEESTTRKKLPQQLLQELIGACANRMDRVHLPYGIAVR